MKKLNDLGITELGRIIEVNKDYEFHVHQLEKKGA
jgi:hypothetical protein